MEGSITGFPIVDRARFRNQCISVRYVKLSLDEHDPRIRDKSFWAYYDHHKAASCEGLLSKCAFPHESTSETAFDPAQFRAYRDLGRWLVQSNAGAWSLLDPAKATLSQRAPSKPK